MTTMAEFSVQISQRANFAVLSRLIACLVTESLLDGIFVPIESLEAAGILIVLFPLPLSESQDTYQPVTHDDVFAVIPLHHVPVVRLSRSDKSGMKVDLVDPMDMLPEIFHFAKADFEKTTLHDLVVQQLRGLRWKLQGSPPLTPFTNAVSAWEKFAVKMNVDPCLIAQISKELQSSYEWQHLTYARPPLCPKLLAPSIDWEQSLVCGHPTHPMHRARRVLPPITLQNDMAYDWYHPRIRFASVPRTSIRFTGSRVDAFDTLARTAIEDCGGVVEEYLNASHCVIPVHELQVVKVDQLFEDVRILPETVRLPALAQSSIRTVLLPDLPEFSLKLAIAVKISSATRTVSHFTATFGPRFSRDIVPKLTMDRRIAKVMCEPVSAVYDTEDEHASKHFTAILRDEYKPPPGEHVIVCAALSETGHRNTPSGVSAVQHVFDLETKESRVSFLEKYIALLCNSLLPPLLHNGVAFEAHAQNMLLRFDRRSRELKGFVIRDLGGLIIHPPTLRKSTGVDFHFLPNHCVVGELMSAYKVLYHTMVHNHLQRLIRVLDLHYDGVGWRTLRVTLSRTIPADHPLRDIWLAPASKMVPGKCLLRMAMDGVYRDYLYRPFPNMIQYQPDEGFETN